MHGLTEKHKILRNKKPTDSSLFSVFLDKATLIAGIIGPIMTVPQIYKIYHYRQAAGVSPFSWLAFAFLDLPFLMYGFYHREKPIIVTYLLWLIANVAVGVGAFIFS